MLWKNNFHGVEKIGLAEEFGAKLFHGVEKMFPRYGKLLWRNGARVGGGFAARGVSFG